NWLPDADRYVRLIPIWDRVIPTWDRVIAMWKRVIVMWKRVIVMWKRPRPTTEESIEWSDTRFFHVELTRSHMETSHSYMEISLSDVASRRRRFASSF